MFNLSLTACSFHIRIQNTRNHIPPINLNDVILIEDKESKVVQNSTIIDCFKGFFEKYSTAINDNIAQKTFSCEFKDTYQGETKDYRYLYTVIYSGLYGSASEIRDITTRKIKHKKRTNEADERPFYLYIVIPKDSEDVKVQKGMLLFQNIGPFGIKTITTNKMIQYFSEHYSLTLRWSTIAADLFIRKILTQGKIKKLTMVKNHLSNDNSDHIGVGYGVETRTISDFTFTESKWKQILDKIQYCTKGRYNLFEFENITYDHLKVLVTIGDRTRIVDVHNIENLSIIEGIPDEIKMADGLPDKELLLKHFENVSNEYLSEMVLSIEK